MTGLKLSWACLLLSVSFSSIASDFRCPLPEAAKALECEGSVKVKNLNDLISYNSNLGLRKGKAKSLVIDFELNSGSIAISTPCKITLAEKRSININGDLCLHANQGIHFGESSNLHANNVRFESHERIIIQSHADIKVENMELVSLGTSEDSRVHFRESASVIAKNLLLEAYSRVSLGSNSNFAISENLALFASDRARLANNVTINANTVAINASKCDIYGKKNSVINSENKFGNCFLESTPNGLFKINANYGFAPHTVEFDASKISSKSYEWNFGDGNVQRTAAPNTTYAYRQAGNYTASLKYLDGKKYKNADSIQIKVKEPINLPPVAFIACDTFNMMVYCNSSGSYDPEGSQLNFKFDYGDGYVEENSSGWTSHAYTLAGLNTVTLTITDAAGNKSTASMQVMPLLPPNQLPIAKFNCDTTNSPLVIYCWNDGIYDPDGTIAIQKFRFDDGREEFLSSTDATRHQFATGGDHEITLTVIDNDGGVTTLSKTFAIRTNNPPIANFECNTYGPQKMNCYSTSTDPDAGDWVAVFDWELGDGAVQSGLAGVFDHTYGANPIYTVKLTVHDQFGGSSTISKDITMIENQAPVALIECHPTSGETYSCNADAHDPDGAIVDKYWTIEGNKISDWSALYNFTNGGDYPVTFTMIDDLGKQATVNTNVHINKTSINFTCNETTPMVYRCSASTIVPSDPNDPISSVVYIFDDADILPGPNVEHEFYSFGTHSIKAQVITVSGVISISVQNITINQKYLAPRPEFIEDVLLGQKVYFDGSLSEQVGRTVSRYEWDFGDGETLSTTDPINTHQYNTYGWFDVKLKVTDANGATAESMTPIFVYNPEVDAPGDETFLTIEGVDTDNDGIRDDVQRWINKNSFESVAAKKAFRELATVYKNQIMNADNVTALQTLEDQKATIATCVDNEIVSEHNVTKSTEFELVYLNSNERMLNFAKIKGNLSGHAPKVTVTSATDTCAKWR